MRRFLLRVFKFIKNQQWLIITLIALISFLVGVAGFIVESGYKISLLNAAYFSVQLFIFQFDFSDTTMNFLLETARWTAPFSLAYATVRTILIVVEEEVIGYKLRSLNRHVVICGLGSKGFRLAKELMGEKVVIIESNPTNEFISICKDMGMIVLVGNATNKHILDKVGTGKAKYIFAVTDKDDINIAIAIRAYELKSECFKTVPEKRMLFTGSKDKMEQSLSKMLRCYVHIGNLKLQSLFKQHYLFKIHDDNFESIIFNIFNICATETIFNFIQKNYHLTTSVYRSQLHILIVGFGFMGESLLVEAAKMCHFSNGKKLKVTILDKKAKKREAQFRLEFLHHEKLDDLIDVQFIPYDAKAINNWEILSIQGEIPFNAVYICAGDEASRIFVSLNLNKLLSMVPIRVFLPEKSGFTPLFGTGHIFAKTQNIEVYNMAEKAYVVEKIIREGLEDLARIIHEEYFERESKKSGSDEENIFSHKNWLSLPEEDKELNMAAALQIPIKLGIIGYDILSLHNISQFQFTDNDVEILSKISHKQWMAERLLSGWTHGNLRDSEEKKHPDLVNWESLSEQSKEKQREFVRSIPKVFQKYTYNQIRDIYSIYIPNN